MRWGILFLVLLTGLFFLQPKPTEDKNWAEILGLSKAEIPLLPITQLSSKVNWLPELEPAMLEAKKSGRPLLVTLRCLPCKQCSDFDKDVLEGGPQLTPLLQQFVCVRITAIDKLDLRIFPIADYQDLDVSWWAWFLSPDAEIYGVFGGRDQISDKTRISIPALRATCQRVLDHHYDPRRSRWNIDGPKPELSKELLSVRKLPGYASWISNAHPEEKKQTCIHCHQASDILRQPAIDAGKFDKRTDFDMWPFPENIGLVLDRDNGLWVKEVEKGSPADKAGLKKGDLLGAAEDKKLFSQADLRGVLHRGPKGAANFTLRWLREGAYYEGVVRTSAGWRKTDLSWRKSVAEARLGAHPGFPWPLQAPYKLCIRLGIDNNKMAIRPWLGNQPPRSPAHKAGLKPSDIIIAINGHTEKLYGRALLVWFRLNHEQGDEVVLKLMSEEGKERDIVYLTQ